MRPGPTGAFVVRPGLARPAEGTAGADGRRARRRPARVEGAMSVGDSWRLGVSPRRCPAWPGAHEGPVEREERAMSKPQIIRAWKDQAYRRNLSKAERAALPEHPAGRLDLDALTAAELAGIAGGHYPPGSSANPTACAVA